MGFESVFTAFVIVIFGLGLSLTLFIVEWTTAGFKVCRKVMNAYNHRLDVKPKPETGLAGVTFDKVSTIEMPNPW